MSRPSDVAAPRAGPPGRRGEDEAPPSGASAAPRRRLFPTGVGVAVLTALTALHAALVWPAYGVGSFDDDGHYLLLARNLSSGLGFLDTSRPGDPVDPLVPPGYPALLAPLVALPGDDLLPARLLSLVCAVALVPLTDLWLRRERASAPVRLTVGALLAGNVVLATYASMVMAETPFLLLLVAAVLALRRAEARGTLGAGLLVGAALAGLLLLKTAAVGLVAGALLWLLLRRRVRAAVAAGAAVAAPQLPLLAVRVLQDVPAVGDRYASEIATFSGVGQLGRALRKYADYAIGDTLVPLGPFFGRGETADALLVALRVATAVLVVVGAVVWQRRRADPTVLMTTVYLVEVLFFPFVNERRVVLVLPFVVLWLVLGGGALARAVPRPARRPVAWALVVLAVVPLALQPTRSYRFPPDVVSSMPADSAYLAMLAELHRLDAADGQDVAVQTSYRWTVSAFTGAHTTRTAFDARCPEAGGVARVREAVAQAGAGYLVVAAFHEPFVVDDPCLLDRLGDGEAGAVRLLRRWTDRATVFQLVGPGTPWPQDVDHLADAPAPPVAVPVPREGFLLREEPEPALRVPAVGGRAELVLPLAAAPSGEVPGPVVPVRQVSVGAVEGPGLDGAAVQLRQPDGAWVTVDARPGDPSFLLARLEEPVLASAVRVVADAAGPVTVHDVVAIGPVAS